MAKRKLHPLEAAADPSTSKRWPNLFANEPLVEALFQAEEWALLLVDLRLKVEEESRDVVRNIPTTETAVAQQNYARGRVSAFMDLLELADDYRQWKESK